MKDTNSVFVFCKVVSGEFTSYKIYEDDKHLAILDLYPNVKGMTLIITKEHYESYAADMGDEAVEVQLVDDRGGADGEPGGIARDAALDDEKMVSRSADGARAAAFSWTSRTFAVVALMVI